MTRTTSSGDVQASFTTANSTVRKTRTVPQTIEFTVPDEGFRHFGARAGEIAIVEKRSCKIPLDGTLCLIEHKLGHWRGFAICSFAKNDPYPDGIDINFGFGRSISFCGPGAYRLIGIVTSFKRNDLNILATAITELLNNPATPEWISRGLQTGINDLYNELPKRSKDTLDRVDAKHGEPSFEYNKALLIVAGNEREASESFERFATAKRRSLVEVEPV